MFSHSAGSNANIIARNTNQPVGEILRRLLNVTDRGEEEAEPFRKGKDLGIRKEEVATANLIKITTNYVIPKALTGKAMMEMLAPLKAADMITSFAPNVLKITHGDNIGQKQKNNLLFDVYTHDAELMGEINLMTKIITEHNEHYKEYEKYTNEHIASGGTDVGLYRRLVTGMTHNALHKHRIKIEITEKRMQRLRELLPWEFTGDYLNTDMELVLPINRKATIGFPFDNEKKEDKWMLAIFELYQQLLAKMNDITGSDEERSAKIIKYDVLNPITTTMKLKNKTQIYKREELLTKVRPYYVLPGHLGFAFGSIHYILNKGTDCSPESDTWAMCGHSWTNKGADRLMRQMTTPEKWKQTVFAKIYSDDGHVAFVGVDGNVYFIAFDIKFHDLSLNKNWAPVIENYLKDTLLTNDGKPIYDRAYSNLITYNVQKAFISSVLLPKDLLTVKKSGFSSGINGTTNMGSIPTVYMLDEVVQNMERKYPMKEFPPEEFGEELIKVFAYYGSTIKEGTQKAYKIKYDEREDTITDFKILGQYLMRIKIPDTEELIWVNIPDPEPLFCALVRPTKRFYGKENTPINRKKFAMERILGICVSGGYLHPPIYDICKEYWNNNWMSVEMDDEMLDNINVMNGTEFSEDFEMDLRILANRPFPEKSWFLSVFTKTRPDKLPDMLITRNDMMSEGSYEKLIEQLDLGEREVIEITTKKTKEVSIPVKLGKLIETPLKIPKGLILTPLEIKRLKKEARKTARAHLGEERIEKYNQSLNNAERRYYGKKKDLDKRKDYRINQHEIDLIMENEDDEFVLDMEQFEEEANQIADEYYRRMNMSEHDVRLFEEDSEDYENFETEEEKLNREAYEDSMNEDINMGSGTRASN